MGKALKNISNRHGEPVHSSPLLPYLCRPPAILALVLVGQLLALALVLVLVNSSHGSFWLTLGTLSMVVQWIVLCSALLLCQIRGLINGLPPTRGGALAFTVCLLVAAVVLWLAQYPRPEPFDPLLWLKSLLIAAIFAGILLRYLYLQQQLSNQQRAELHARIQSLQARIRPHFLFNSINTIASLIRFDPAAAEQTLEDLSDLFRYSLQSPGLVSLDEEVQLCRRYIAIEQRRLGQRLEMRWDFTEPLPAIQVPSLLLQPLLENAIHHGIQKLPGGGVLTLNIVRRREGTTIKIGNPIVAPHPDEWAGKGAREGEKEDGQEKEQKTGHRIALDNIRHRLQLYFGKGADLRIDYHGEGNYFQVIITLPNRVDVDLTNRFTE